jgi:hypothetical protein
LPKQHTAPSFRELVSEVPDRAAGAGMLIFTLARFELPALALTALAAVAFLVLALASVVLVARVLRTQRWRRCRDRWSGATEPAGCGDGQAGTSRRRSAAVFGLSVELDLAAAARSGTGQARW